MVTGLFEKMSPERGMAQAFLEPLFKEYGPVGSVTLRILEDWGISYRKTDFYSDWRRITGRPAREDLMKYVRKIYRPPARLMEYTPEYLSKEFQVQFTVRGYDPMTGEPIDTGYNLATDTLASMGDLEWEMKTLLERFPEDYPMVIEEIFVRNVKTRMAPL